MTNRGTDLICIGRAAVDLYGEQVGSRLEDMTSFAKYLGGCPANIAVGTARLGLKVAMLTRVGDEHMGRFVRETLARECVDVSLVTTDPKRLTALVILGIRDEETFPLIFYRENCADMGISVADIEKAAEAIRAAKAVLVSGTHFSTSSTDAACKKAMTIAKEAGGRVIFDIDYRPVLWGLTSPGLGEQRFVASDSVTDHLQSIVGSCDLIVGTEEEFHIAGGNTDTITALKSLREKTQALFAVKRGPMGCVMFPSAIPDRLEQGISGDGFPVEVFNVLGAGDAFMSGFLSGWLRGRSLQECARLANGCGALVVARHGCAPAMPTTLELDHFLQNKEKLRQPRLDLGLSHIHRVTTRPSGADDYCILAFDHRSQFEEIARPAGKDEAAIKRFKLLVEAAALQVNAGTAKKGIIVDDRFGASILNHSTGSSLWIARPIELPGAVPLIFEGGYDVGVTLRTWPSEHVVKCLAFYHADDPIHIRNAHEQQLLRLQDAVQATGHEWLLEIIPLSGRDVTPDGWRRTLSRLYDIALYPDWWKLPQPRNAETWRIISDVIQERDRYCRGVLLLGLDAPEQEFAKTFKDAAEFPICKGFAVGRSIFGPAARKWFADAISDESAIADMAGRYQRLVDLWHESRNKKKTELRASGGKR